MGIHYVETMINIYDTIEDVMGSQQTMCQTIHKIVKNFKIMKFDEYIRDHHGKCIQISANMPSIGFVILWKHKMFPCKGATTIVSL